MGSVEDTPKTVGKPSEKLPTFRIILIEVRCNADSRCTNGRQHAKREPELMPPISSHTLRHTGCIRLGENNVNPKVMQYVMGHSDAQITMNIYNHIAEKSHVENEMSKMNLTETVPAVV